MYVNNCVSVKLDSFAIWLQLESAYEKCFRLSHQQTEIYKPILQMGSKYSTINIINNFIYKGRYSTQYFSIN